MAQVLKRWQGVGIQIGPDLCRSVRKPGGRVAIVDFRKDAPQGPPVEFRFTPDQLSGELAQAGFQLQTSHDFLPQQLFLIYRVK